jgi:hypothetical protein
MLWRGCLYDGWLWEILVEDGGTTVSVVLNCPKTSVGINDVDERLTLPDAARTALIT